MINNMVNIAYVIGFCGIIIATATAGAYLCIAGVSIKDRILRAEFILMGIFIFLSGAVTTLLMWPEFRQQILLAQSASATPDCSKPLSIAEIVELIEKSKDMQLIDNSPEQVCYTVEFPDEHLSIDYIDRGNYGLSEGDKLIYTWEDGRGLPFFVFMWEDIATGELIHLHHTEKNPEVGNMSFLPEEVFRRWALSVLCKHTQ